MTLSSSSESTLIDYIKHHAATRPDELSVCELMPGGQRRELSWRELRNAAQSLAVTLARDYPDHTVMMALPNCAEAQIALLGSLWSGSRTFPVSPQLPIEGFRRLVEKVGKTVLIASQELIDAATTSFDATLVAETLAVEAVIRSRVLVDVLLDESRHGSVLLESSGTTGLPKIVQREMRSLTALGENLTAALKLAPSDRILVSILLCHSYGIDIAMAAATVAGCEIELHRQYSPAAARAALRDRKISVWPAVPLMFDSISRDNEPAPPNKLRLAISAGSPLPGRIYEQFLSVFDISIGQIYGASEFGSVFYGSPEIFPFDPLAVGRPLEGVEARVLNMENPDINHSLPNGVEGEIAIRAPSMLTDYFEDVEGPDENGFIQTGDIGTLDDGGVLRLTGRVKLLIDIGAKKVNPLEIEALLIKHPSVSEAVVLAVPYSDSADRVKALVLPREGQSPDPSALRAYLRKFLIAYKIPRGIEVRETFPRSPTGKVLRSVLQAEVYGAKG